MSLTKVVLAATLPAICLLSGCANDNERYRADVYGPGSLNQVQKVRMVEILSIQSAKVALPNSTKNSTAQIAGSVLGAVAGAVIGNQFGHGPHDRQTSRIVGGIAGGVLGNRAANLAAGETDYQNGVPLTYRLNDQLYTSVQAASPCEYKLGTAMMVQQNDSSSRIQPNNPGGCGSTGSGR